MGYHEVVVLASKPQGVVLEAKFGLILPLLYYAAVLFPKLAILAIYLRIFTHKLHRAACWALAAVLIALWFASTLSVFFMCTPIAYLWDRTIPGGHCFQINTYYRYISLPNIVTDLIIFVLPLPVVWKLHTSRNIKIGLTITFATASMSVFTSIQIRVSPDF